MSVLPAPLRDDEQCTGPRGCHIEEPVFLFLLEVLFLLFPLLPCRRLGEQPLLFSLRSRVNGHVATRRASGTIDVQLCTVPEVAGRIDEEDDWGLQALGLVQIHNSHG